MVLKCLHPDTDPIYPRLEITLKLAQIECPRIDFHRDFRIPIDPKFGRQLLDNLC